MLGIGCTYYYPSRCGNESVVYYQLNDKFSSRCEYHKNELNPIEIGFHEISVEEYLVGRIMNE